MVYHWDRGAGTNSWADGANWYNSLPSRNNTVPLAGADLVFGGMPSGSSAQVINQHTANLSVRSLWFEAGRDYRIQGSGSFKFSSPGPIISVLAGGHAANRYVFDLPLEVTAGSGAVEIHNYSAGLLDIRKRLNLNNNSLSIYGGVTHIGSLSGGTTIGGLSDSLTTVILTRLSPSAFFNGAWTVAENGLLILRMFALPVVQEGGSVALGSGYGGYPGSPPFPYTVQGAGVVRREGAAPIGVLYNESGDHTLNVNLTLAGDTTLGARAGRADGLTFSGGLTPNSHDLTKVGSGKIELQKGVNSYGALGVIRLNEGVLGFSGNSQWANWANLHFDGGIFSFFNSGNPTASLNLSLGTGANQIRWIGDGGFSSDINGYSLAVRLNNGSELFWGQGRFVPNGRKLLLSSRYAKAEIRFTNAINLGAGLREVRVERGWAQNYTGGFGPEYALAQMSGVLSDDDLGGGILKTGPGQLRITGANTYTGATRIREGALRGNIPSASHIELDGGVLGLDGNFTRGRFAAGGRIIWLGSGGFAAYGANRTVRIDNQTTSAIGWGWNNFVPDGQELRFGHYSADAAVIWDRVLSFGNAMRTIRVERGQALGSSPNLVDVIFNRALENTAKTGGLRLVGDGRADFAADSSSLNSDLLEISGVELRLTTASARLGAIGNIRLSEGGKLAFINRNDSGVASTQINDATAITLNTGELRYDGRLSGSLSSLPSTEKVGNLTLSGGANTIAVVHNAGDAGYTELQVESFQRAASSRATLSLGVWGAGQRSRFRASSTLAGHMLGGISPWATISGQTWATTDPSDSNHFATLAESAYTSGTNYSGNYTLASASTTTSITGATLNSLRFTGVHSNSATPLLSWTGTLRLTSGGFLVSSGLSANRAVILGGTGVLRTSEGRPLYTHVYRGGLDFRGSLRVMGEIDWVKTGPAPLRYRSTGTSQIGSLYVHQGTVEVSAGEIKINTSGEVFIGDGAGRDELRLIGGTNRLGNRPKVTLRGTPYGRGAEFGAYANIDQATLALQDGAYQSLRELHIVDRGTLDFSGGNPSAPNLLFLDTISFNNAEAQLFVRGWEEYSDYLLIKKTAFAAGQWAQKLKQIFFDGHSIDYDLLASDYNGDYFQISPWGSWSGSAVPEPSTYGAILGVVGVGLYLIRRRRRAAPRGAVA